MTEPRRRKRLAISCALCRKRKLRCNRETPCSNCLRSKNGICVYDTQPSPPTRHAPPLQPQCSEGPQVPKVFQSPFRAAAVLTPQSMDSQSSVDLCDMRLRIVELEEELSRTKQLVHTPSQSTMERDTTTDHVPLQTSLTGSIAVFRERREFGRNYAIARGIAHKNRCFGQSHWMNGFVVFEDVIRMLEPQLRTGPTPLLQDVYRAKMLARKIKAQRSPSWPSAPTDELPSRGICDALIEGYLRTSEPLYRILHVPSFCQEYQALWDHGKKLKTLNMIRLKLVLALGSVVYDDLFSLRSLAMQWIYEAQTWLSSPTFKAQLGIEYVQASILLLLGREQVDVGGEMCWISAGAVLRTAVCIGLHKDPAQLPRLGIWEREMRRRLWNTIIELNLQTSLISGGPCYLSLEDFSTQPPANFDDEDLSSEDPIAKPDNIYTASSASIILRTTFPIRLAIVKFLNDSSTSGTYEQTLRIDKQMRIAFKTVRQMLQELIPSTASPAFVTKAVTFIMHRYISALHIPFFNPSLHEAAYAFSRTAVVDSSLKIWTLATAKASVDVERDLTRLCRCGAGFFRTYTFHASSFLAAEFCAQLQDGESIPRPELVNICDEAAAEVLQCIEAGETGIKGYILLKILAAKVEGLQRGIKAQDLPALLVNGAEQAVKQCLPVLEKKAGEDSEGQTGDGAIESFDDTSVAVPPDFLQDWDMVMADVFNLNDLYDFDTFLNQ